MAFSSLLLIVPMLLFMGFPPTPALIAIGLAGVSAAVALNRAALRRNQTYRHSEMPIAYRSGVD